MYFSYRSLFITLSDLKVVFKHRIHDTANTKRGLYHGWNKFLHCNGRKKG